MVNTLPFGRVTNWLKMFTYISGTVLLTVNNGLNNLTLLLPLVALIFFINYARDYWLIPGKKPTWYIWTSVVLEMCLIIAIGFIDIANINLLFFFVCISSVIISYPFSYSLILTAVYIPSAFYVYAVRNGFGEMMDSLLPMFLNYGVSTAFVMIMSYLVKMQIREKEKIAHVNSELEQAYKRLIESSAAAQKLTVEQERTRMAREIHDTLAHTMTALIVQLEACKKLASLDPSRLPAELEKAQELSRSGFNDIKRSIKALRPQVMEDKSLFATIAVIINETMKNTGVDITLTNLLPNDIKLSSQTEVAIFRVIQESITNSIRHGQADQVDIVIKLQNDILQLNIEDNGMGCANIKKGYGMQGIIERVESMNGSVTFSSSYGKGFKTKVSIPYKAV